MLIDSMHNRGNDFTGLGGHPEPNGGHHLNGHDLDVENEVAEREVSSYCLVVHLKVVLYIFKDVKLSCHIPFSNTFTNCIESHLVYQHKYFHLQYTALQKCERKQ